MAMDAHSIQAPKGLRARMRAAIVPIPSCIPGCWYNILLAPIRPTANIPVNMAPAGRFADLK